MMQRLEVAIAEEDQQLIEEHQLGALQHTYRLKLSYTRFFRYYGWIFLVLAMGILITTIIFGFIDWQRSLALQQQISHNPANAFDLQEEQERVDFDFSLLVTPLMGGLYALFKGLLIVRVEIPRAQRERVIVCEHGILHVRRKIRSNHVDVVHWEEMIAIKRSFRGKEYDIQYGEGRFLTLKGYQDLDELIALIKQQSGVT